jgi:hypothetical protein
MTISLHFSGPRPFRSQMPAAGPGSRRREIELVGWMKVEFLASANPQSQMDTQARAGITVHCLRPEAEHAR